MTKILLLIFSLLILISNQSYSKNSIKAEDFLVQSKSVGSSLLVTSTSVFDFDAAQAHKLLATQNSIVVEDFPVSGYESKNIILERQHSIIDANTKFLVGGNEIEKIIKPDFKRFSGTIEGEIGSEVFLTIIGEHLFCSMSNPNGKSVSIAPTNDISNQCMLLDNSKNPFDRNYNFNCYTDDLKIDLEKKIRLTQNRMLSDEMLEVEIALETDSEFFKACGSDLEKARNYALAIFSMVSAIYEKQLNITLYIPWMKNWTSSPADPYDCQGNPFDLKDKVKQYWLDEYADVERDIYHVMTSISYGGGGYGYFDALCRKDGYEFSTSSVQCQHHYPTFAFTYDVYIVAHEMGHNFNAQHTHSCFWGAPLDTCITSDAISGGCLAEGTNPKPNPGSIMSYCGGTNSDFGLGYQMKMYFREENIEIMRKAAQAAECVTPIPDPEIFLLNPNSREVYKPGDVLEITWKSLRVDDIYVSIVDKKGNKLVLETVNAGLEKYDMTIPDAIGNDFKVKLESLVDEDIWDISQVGFAIKKDDQTDMLADFKFMGNTINSINGEFPDAEIVGNIEYVSDRFDQEENAVKFSENGYLYIPDADCRLNEISVSFWLKADQLQDKSFMIGTDYGPGLSTFSIYHWGVMGWSLYQKSGLKQAWGGGIGTNKWTHAVYVYDGKKSWVYIDANLSGETDVEGELVPFSTAVYIGARNGNEYFHGTLDDIKIFNRAISQEEVTDLFNDNPVSVEEPTKTNLNFVVSPNPFVDEITVNGKSKSIKVMNILGKVVYQSENAGSCNSIKIQTSEWQSGVYFLVIDGKIEKIIKSN
jgi:concanavalin A-like lectin/glucanase superfamily protein/metallopeptidase family M12-like protein/type IX secretion system substrate protein